MKRELNKFPWTKGLGAVSRTFYVLLCLGIAFSVVLFLPVISRDGFTWAGDSGIESVGDWVVIEGVNHDEQDTRLRWWSETAPVEVHEENGEKKSTATLTGNYSGSFNQISINLQAVSINDNGDFTVTLPITEDTTILDFRVEADGQIIEEHSYTLRKVNAPEAISGGSDGTHYLSFQYGLSGVSYTETDLPNAKEIATVFRGEYGYYFPSRKWDMNMSGYYNVLPLFTVKNDNISDIRYMGFGLRIGYTLFADSDVEFRLLLGLSYLTMVASEGVVGTKNMYGPMVGMAGELQLGDDVKMHTYLKFSPLSSNGLSFLANGISLISGSFEIKGGGSFSWPLGNTWRYHLVGELSQVTVRSATDLFSNTRYGVIGVGLSW